MSSMGPYAAYCIDLMLRDIHQTVAMHNTIYDGREITSFIYNHNFTAALLRQFTNDRQILRPSFT